jgi:hypothetical protein
LSRQNGSAGVLMSTARSANGPAGVCRQSRGNIASPCGAGAGLRGTILWRPLRARTMRRHLSGRRAGMSGRTSGGQSVGSEPEPKQRREGRVRMQGGEMSFGGRSVTSKYAWVTDACESTTRLGQKPARSSSLTGRQPELFGGSVLILSQTLVLVCINFFL